MSEQFSDQDPQLATRAAIAERVSEQLGWLNEMARTIGGPAAIVPDVFEAPVVSADGVRNDGPMPEWPEEQVERVITLGRLFGYGAQEDVGSGLHGGLRVAEGGKVWKIMAEAKALDQETGVTTVVFSGSPTRHIGEDERNFLIDRGIQAPEGMTEYDFADVQAKMYADAEKDIYDEPFGYEIAPGNPVVELATGQLKHIGRSATGRDVKLLRIDSEPYFDEEKKRNIERYRPDTARVMTMLAEKLTKGGDLTSPIAMATSNTYASRVPDTIRASLDLEPPRQLGVVMYGRQTITGLNAPVPAEMPLNHYPGDLRVMYDKLVQLSNVVKANDL